MICGCKARRESFGAVPSESRTVKVLCRSIPSAILKWPLMAVNLMGLLKPLVGQLTVLSVAYQLHHKSGLFESRNLRK